MSRLILLIVLLGAVVAAIWLVIDTLRSAASGPDLPAVRNRRGALQIASWVLLMAVMIGVGTGILGTD